MNEPRRGMREVALAYLVEEAKGCLSQRFKVAKTWYKARWQRMLDFLGTTMERTARQSRH